MRCRVLCGLGLSMSTMVWPVYAQAVDPAAATEPRPADKQLAPIKVQGQTSEARIARPLVSSDNTDAAAAMKDVPGGALLDNGGVSGQVQYRGAGGYRNNVQIDGMSVNSGGPNWMDPPLHYAAGALVEEMTVVRGIPSVADSIDSIGTTVKASTRQSDYAISDDYVAHGWLASTIRSVNNSYSLSGQTSLANQDNRIGVTGVTDQASDTRTPYGLLRGSSYDRRQIALDAGHRGAYGDTSFFIKRQSTGNTGTPSLPLDIDFFDTTLTELKHRMTVGQTQLEAKLDYNHVEHQMANYLLRPTPDISPMNGPAADPRFIRARAQGYGTSLSASHPLWGGDLKGGFDGRWTQNDAHVGNPDMPGFRVDAFDSIRRNYYSAFGQWQGALAGPYAGELGVRYTRVDMSAGPGGVAQMLPKPAQRLAAQFAASDRDQTDNNFDVVAKLSRHIGQRWQVSGELARRTRSPYYIERYAYIPLEASAGLADGNNVIGDTRLDPEVSYQANLGLDFTASRLSVSPQVYYHRIHDYITPIAFDDTPGVIDTDVERVSRVNGDPTPLRYANVDAEIYGADVAASWQMTNRWSLDGGGGYTRGKRTDTNENLYRIAPANLRLALQWQTTDWRLRVQQRYVFQQDKFARSNNDPRTADPRTGGYALTAVSARYRLADNLDLTVGVDNLFDKGYRDFLSGYNRVGDSAVPVGARLPGAGRNAYATLKASF